MKKAAQAVDKIARALMTTRTEEKALPCCLLGGVAPFIEPWLSEELRSTFVARQGDANAGAMLMIRERVKKDRL
jgi:N-acetylglucosamine kinase-like BadF-type ATPase